MITKQNLINLGFKEIFDIFTGKQVLVLGEEDTEICGSVRKMPIIYYNLETQSCKVVRYGFCDIERECKSEEEIIKFVESINFLFHTNIDIIKDCDYKICKITNDTFSWILEVDNETITFNGQSNAEYFGNLYTNLGYKIIWNGRITDFLI
jgi:hypothetical protein